MPPYVVAEKCTGCGLCQFACPYAAIGVEDGLAVVLPHCTDCWACLDSCPEGALVQALAEDAVAPAETYRHIWVYAETSSGRLRPVSRQAMGRARELADQLGVWAEAVVFGEGAERAAEDLLACGADRVRIGRSPGPAGETPEACARALGRLIREERPEAILLGATELARGLAPRLAQRLGTGVVSGCVDVQLEYGSRNLLFTRLAHGGALDTTVVVPRRPQIATILADRLPEPMLDTGRQGTIAEVPSAYFDGAPWVTLLDVGELIGRKPIGEARVVVAGGRGMGGPGAFALLERLAELLGGTVGASRAAVDAGWIGAESQVGLSGSRVKADLYIACGISGAFQHVAALSSVGTLVAINTDPAAPVMEIADYGLVGDVKEVVPALVERIQADRV